MKVNERTVVGGGLIGHSTGRRSLSTVGGDTRVSHQPWREIDAHDRPTQKRAAIYTQNYLSMFKEKEGHFSNTVYISTNFYKRASNNFASYRIVHIVLLVVINLRLSANTALAFIYRLLCLIPSY